MTIHLSRYIFFNNEKLRFWNKNIHITCPFKIKFWKNFLKVLKFVKQIYLELLVSDCLHIYISDSIFMHFFQTLYPI